MLGLSAQLCGSKLEVEELRGEPMTEPSQYAYGAMLQPSRLYTRNEVLARRCPVPARPGVYAWYFREVPPSVPVQGCHIHDGVPLL
jgi:hypothetical protein